MVEIESILLLMSITLLAALTPGPDLVFITSQAIGRPIKYSIVAVFGIASGCLVYLIAFSLGFGLVIEKYPVLLEIIRWFGIVYLLYLSFTFFKCTRSSGGIEMPNGISSLSIYQVYLSAIIVNILNPKTLLYFVALLSPFVNADNGNVGIQYMILGGSAYCVGVPIYLLWAFLINFIGNKFLDKMLESSKILNYILTIIFAVFALSLLFIEIN